MTFDESNARLTQELAGRRIDYLVRKGKELHIICTDGHTVVIQADIHGDIQYKQTDVSVVMPSFKMLADKGNF